MITAYLPEDGRLAAHPLAAGEAAPAAAIWVDLREPGEGEREAVARATGLSLPSRAHMEEIEASSRAREEEGVLFLSLLVATGGEREGLRTTPVAFVLGRNRLVTQRYADLPAFRLVPTRRLAGAEGAPEEVLLALLETTIDQTADLLERVANRVDGVARDVLDRGSHAGGDRGFRPLLQEIGRAGDGASRLRESLVSFELVLAFLEGIADRHRLPRERLDTLARDIRSLADYASFVSGKIGFLLDAVLGLVNIEQNNIVKIFSVMALVFMPPTLIASIYGMNFRHMPELDWPLAYPLALLLMVLSAILPYRYFRRRGWL